MANSDNSTYPRTDAEDTASSPAAANEGDKLYLYYVRNTLRGKSMGEPLLTIGSYIFSNLEVPEKIVVRSKTRLVVHQLGSGSSIVDALGEEPEIVSFSGIFAGENAEARARPIEAIRSNSAPVPLVWGSRTLQVVIQRFELTYVSNRWIPYKISCYVLKPLEQVTANKSFAIEPSPNAQVSDILGLLQNTGVTLGSDQIAALVKSHNCQL